MPQRLSRDHDRAGDGWRRHRLLGRRPHRAGADKSHHQRDPVWRDVPGQGTIHCVGGAHRRDQGPQWRRSHSVGCAAGAVQGLSPRHPGRVDRATAWFGPGPVHRGADRGSARRAGLRGILGGERHHVHHPAAQIGSEERAVTTARRPRKQERPSMSTIGKSRSRAGPAGFALVMESDPELRAALRAALLLDGHLVECASN